MFLTYLIREPLRLNDFQILSTRKYLRTEIWRRTKIKLKIGIVFTFGNKLTFWLADSPLWRLVQLKAWF